jgi:hypothetical protein
MNRVLELARIRSAPPRDSVLLTQGIPAGRPVPERVTALAEEARELYRALTEPRGVVADISAGDFLELYQGEGKNQIPTPLPGIVERAHRLALFAATLGEPVSAEIAALFRANDPALGAMLDGIASERADAAATNLSMLFLESLRTEGELPEGSVVLPYSPGYCGWHVSGQLRLFAALDPGRIGISLNESFLMSPVKSVSGVLVVGTPETHDFENDFDFCLDCATWDCRERIASLTSSPTEKTPRST